MSRLLVVPFFRGKENHMWNMDYIYDLPLVIKIIILIVGLDVFLIAYWTGAKEKDIENDETEKPLDEKSRSSIDD